MYKMTMGTNWQHAAAHHYGQGMHHGVSFHVAQKVHKMLVRQGDYKRARLLELFVTGGMWDEMRCKEAKYITDGLCPHMQGGTGQYEAQALPTPLFGGFARGVDQGN